MSLAPLPELKKIAKPTVLLGRDEMVFTLFDDGGEPVAQHILPLAKLVEDRDAHGLLLWSIVYQMHSQNVKLAVAQQAPQQQYNLDELLDKAMGAAERFAKAGGR